MKYKIGQNEIKMLKKLPKGWKRGEGSSLPGTVWISNKEPAYIKGKDGMPRKNPKYSSALLITDEKYLIHRIAASRRWKGSDHIDKSVITDKTTEARVRAEVNRQNQEQRAWERELENLAKKVGKREAKKPTVKKSAKKK